MKMIVLMLMVAFAPGSVLAAGGSGAPLEHMEVRLSDQNSLQNGAKLFVNYCLSCHSAEYMRYGRLVDDLGIPAELVEKNMIFSSDKKIGDTMTTTMPEKKAAEWFGVAPPDLSLIGRLRDASWLYSYLKGFYLDSSTVSGWNNTIFPNVAMPHVLADLQGRRTAVFSEHDGALKLEGFEQVTEGSMSEQEFDHAMRDLTNYLVYMGEPVKLKRGKYGMYVILFLLIFGVLAFLLKREYWRDVDVSH